MSSIAAGTHEKLHASMVTITVVVAATGAPSLPRYVHASILQEDI